MTSVTNNQARTIISLDFTKKAWEQSGYLIHNRWHPDIPAVATVKPEEVFRVQAFDASGGQVINNDSADDIRNVEFGRVHCLSGPIAVEGAQPGDYLEVEILDVQPIKGYEWGYTGIYDIHNGASFMYDVFPNAAKAIWEFEGIYARSRHIPGVKCPGLIHPGVVGTAPSKQLMDEWNRREAVLVGSDPNRVPPLAPLPDANGALMGALDANPEEALTKAREAPRTIAPRENGGNIDIKNLSKGSKLWLPVFVPGANLSVGDMHFSQGDGEISTNAIEMHGEITLKVNLIKNGASHLGHLSMPMFTTGPVEPHFSKYLGFGGISVDEQGTQRHIDATESFRQACLNAIEYFKRFGYSAEQVYLFLSCLPMEGRINNLVNVPNAYSTISVPSEIFEFDILPSAHSNVKIIKTNCPIFINK